jgi:hypothetical protein
MKTIKVKDGTEIFYKRLETVNPFSFITGGLYQVMTGMHNDVFSKQGIQSTCS